MANPILDAARAKRAAKQEEMDALLATVETEERAEFNDDEVTKFEELAKSLKKLDKQIEGLEAENARSEKATAAAAVLAADDNSTRGAVVTREERTYERNGPNSFIQDLSVIAASGPAGDEFGGRAVAAKERLQRHAKETEVEARHDPELAQQLTEIRETPSRREQRVNPNTTDGTGGEFVPPLWLVGQYIPLARPGRVIANRMRHEQLPAGTDSINLPKIKTGTATAIQAAQANAVQSTDLTTSTVTAAVNTIAGQQDFSMQLLDQSPIDMTSVIFEDLSADYDQRLDLQVISGTGANGQHLGIFGQTAAAANSTTSFNSDQTKMNAVTCASVLFWDGTTATSFTQHRSILNAKTNIQMARVRTPTAIYVHPRRANHWQTASDSTIGRPLYTSYGRFNALGGPSGAEAEGEVGEVAGTVVVQDANIPIVCSTGAIVSGTGDMIGVVFEPDMILYEGALRMRVLPEILSGTLQMRVQIYAYSAFFPHRYPPSTTLITGTTGLAAPSW